MRINNFLIWLLIVCSNTFLDVKAQKHNKATAFKHKIIMQFTTNDTVAWKGLLKNIKNLKQGWANSVLIYVVARGQGIEFLMQEKIPEIDKINSFSKNGIVFLACENTMKERNILKEAMISQAGFVKMGLSEIVLKQEQGWSYLKAGF